jgi:DNA-binding NarL/FixJ family response regulator
MTEAERAVLMLIGDGVADAQIAVALAVSPETIRRQVASVLAKMQVRSRTEAAILAMKSGWLPD